jgi:hypothetical protein
MVDGRPGARTNKEHFISQSCAARIDSSDPLTGDRDAPPVQRPAFSSHGRSTILVAGEGAADDGGGSGGDVRRDPLGGNERPSGLSAVRLPDLLRLPPSDRRPALAL